MWYAEDERLITKSAAKESMATIESIRRGAGASEPLLELQLFQAMHVCAYWAINGGAGKRTRPPGGMSWAEAWGLIRDDIVKRNLALVYSMVGRFSARDLDREELACEGLFGLSQAVERFDPWRGFRFSTYACHAIHRSMIRASKAATNYRRLFPVQHEEDFEKPAPEGKGEDLFVERLQLVLDGNLASLNHLESDILSKRFPPDRDLRRLTLKQVGAAVGLSKERVRQIQNIALAKLRETLLADPALQ